MGSSKWERVKQALGLKFCTYVPMKNDDFPASSESFSGASLVPPSVSPASSRWSKLSRSLSRSSKNTCSICLATMRRGDGHAIFTAECSHSFHFHCIASSVKHGNQLCPICRAKWNEVPLQSPSFNLPSARGRITPVDWPHNNGLMTVVRRLPPPPRPNSNRHVIPVFPATEPAVYNDDETLDPQPGSPSNTESIGNCDFLREIKIDTFPEFSAVPKFNSYDNFTVLIRIKAPVSASSQNDEKNQVNLPQIPRAAVDLVTVLDISGSMAGTKLALLKRAMGFVIQNLGPNDRLSVIAFSSTARRLFPLRRMSDTGKHQALQAVNSLVANGGTNIAEGLRKGAKIMGDRKEKNPVGNIILLSDGQDTYTVHGSIGNQQHPNYHLLLPLSIHGNDISGFRIPVHAFGFGTDHDASLLHSISEISGGTFSFIETESVIQDAFAQCIGGLLSVVVKDLQIYVECLHPTLTLTSLRSGSYANRVMTDRRTGCIDVGDLYADEERDFLVSVNLPADSSSNDTSLLKVKGVYNNPLTREMQTKESEEVSIKRDKIAGNEAVSIEVDRQRNRFLAADAMADARAAAERGDLGGAVSILESCRKVVLETVSAKSGDQLCAALDAELKEVQERMVSRQVYEASGRAYVLSGMSSHSWQRATARGDSTDSSSLIRSYQTPSMTQMLSRSQTSLVGSPAPQRLQKPR